MPSMTAIIMASAGAGSENTTELKHIAAATSHAATVAVETPINVGGLPASVRSVCILAIEKSEWGQCQNVEVEAD